MQYFDSHASADSRPAAEQRQSSSDLSDATKAAKPEESNSRQLVLAFEGLVNSPEPNEVPVDSLQFPASSITVCAAKAQPERQKSRKSMSRRSGQSGTLVKQGRWWRVRVRLDQRGIEKRTHPSLKVAPVSLKLSKSELQRLAAEKLQEAGANSVERFNRIVLGEVTFREQKKAYLQEAVSRNRKPIRNTASIEGAMAKWILPAIGDMPLSLVDNLALKPLVKKMVAGGLSPRTVNKYVEYVRQVVKSLKAPNGEPIHKRTWDAETMDLPVVKFNQQNRPALNVETVNLLIAAAEPGQECVLFVLLAASGLRISEALALETEHFINCGRTIIIEQQVEKDCPRIVKYLKTDAAKREVDLSSSVAEYLRSYINQRNGLVFQTKHGTPHLYGNLENRWLTPRLSMLKLEQEGMGWHSFRRFRNTWLRLQRTQDDILKYWMGHKPETMTELYSHAAEDLKMRLAEADRVGDGFNLPKSADLCSKCSKKDGARIGTRNYRSELKSKQLVGTVGV
jgi:integrase